MRKGVAAMVAGGGLAVAAAAQPANVIDRPGVAVGTVTMPSRVPTIDPALAARVEIERLRAEVDQLKAQVAQLSKQAVQASFDSSLLHSLEARFLSHRHRVNGDVGNGFTTTIDGAKQTMTYMLPVRNDDARLKARETGTPF